MLYFGIFGNRKVFNFLKVILCTLVVGIGLVITQNVLADPAINGSLIWGQPNSTSNAVNNGGLSANSLNNPYGIAVDGSGNIFVADALNNRVLYYPVGQTTATRVIGQPNSTSNAAGLANNRFNFPDGLVLDANGGLYVADRNNNRVLYFPKNSSVATQVYGQTNFTAKVSGTGQDKFKTPTGLALASDGGLYVADAENNRVLFFPPGSKVATRVYGQPNFNDRGQNNDGISAKSLYYPNAVGLAKNGGVYIADTFNNRVLFYPGSSTTATVVYGQAGFNTNYSDQHSGNLQDLFNPYSLVADNSGGLYVADTTNGRVLHYAAGSTTAFYKYGKPEGDDRIISGSTVNVQTLNYPVGVALSPNGGLFVSDFYDNRVVLFPQLNPVTVTLTVTPDPAESGQVVALKAKITVPSGATVPPHGIVTFRRVNNLANLGTASVGVDGIATLNLTSLLPDTYTLEAIYSGDYTYSYSKSAPVTTQVFRPRVQVNLTSSASSTNPGSSVMYSVTITPPPNSNIPLTGQIYIISDLYGGSYGGYGEVNADGTVQPIPVIFYKPGNYKVWARYIHGGQQFEPSNSNMLDLAVAIDTDLNLTSSTNPINFSDPMTLTAKLGWTKPPNQGISDPTGPLTFKSDGEILGTANFDATGQAQLVVSNLKGGIHNLTAEYAGDANYNKSVSEPLSQTVNRLNTSIWLTSTLLTANYGQTIVFTGSVSANTGSATLPAGRVVLKEGNIIVGSGVVDSIGKFSISLWNFAAGSHTIDAEYSGDTNYNPSISTSLTLTISIPAAWEVNSSSDDGTGTLEGTFSYALQQANSSDKKYITFDPNLTTINFNGGIIPDVGTGVVIYGGCSNGPDIQFQFNGSSLTNQNYSLVLKGGAVVMGIEVNNSNSSPKGLSVTSLNNGPNLIYCVKID